MDVLLPVHREGIGIVSEDDVTRLYCGLALAQAEARQLRAALETLQSFEKDHPELTFSQQQRNELREALTDLLADGNFQI